MPASSPLVSATKSWEKYGMVERAVVPSISGATGTSRQPRTVRPSSPHDPLDGVDGLGAVLVLDGQEGHADGVVTGGGQLEAGGFAQERVRDLEQDARAVARVGFGAGGSAVFQVAQDGERLLHEIMARLAGEGGHKADTAGVVLVAGVVHPLRGGAPVHERGTRTHGSPVVVIGLYALPVFPGMRNRDDVGPLRFRAGYMMAECSRSGYSIPACGRSRGMEQPLRASVRLWVDRRFRRCPGGSAGALPSDAPCGGG